jgi:hypothetical protein
MLLVFRQLKKRLTDNCSPCCVCFVVQKESELATDKGFCFRRMNAGECAREAIFDSDYPPRRAKLEPCVLCVDCDRTWRPL